jgi:hypothetical protein
MVDRLTNDLWPDGDLSRGAVDHSVHNPVGILGTQYLGVVRFAAGMGCYAKITGLLLQKTP